MKSVIYFAIFIVLCFSRFCYGQEHTLTIQNFEAQELKMFDAENDIITPITLEEGFTLRIKKTSQITKAELKKNGKFAETNLPPDPSSDATYSKIYKGVKITAKTNDTVEVQIHKNDGSPVIVKLIVGQDNQESNNSIPIKLPDGCKVTKNYDNIFGEDVKYYDKRKVVYVYDFNKDPSKREFYKITKKNKVLKIEVVNFNNETLTSGKNVKFKVYNINKFMYDVSIADSVIKFDSKPSALFTRLFLGDSTLLGSLMGAFSDKIIIAEANDEMKELKMDIKNFVEKYNVLQNTVLDAYDPCYSFPCCYSIEYAQFANYLARIRANAIKIQQQLEDKKKIMAENMKKLEDCDKAKADTAATNQKIMALKSKATLSETEKKELEALKTEKKGLEKSVCNDKDYRNWKTLKKNAENELFEIPVINTLLTNLPSDKELKKVIVFLRNMVETNNSHTSDYISLNGNLLELTISITPKDSIFKYFSIPEYKISPLQIQIPIVGKAFVSFSSGSFIALDKHLQNKTYAWQGTVGNNNSVKDSSYTLVKSGYTLPPMGFCALGNLECKISRSMGLGGSAGVGLTIEKTPRMAYLGGLSLFFGDLRQFTITGGFVGMQVNKLTNNYQTVADHQIIYTSKPNIEYYGEFKVGSFISLTYTPFKAYKPKNR